MIVTCPACSAQYVLPDEAIGEKGRRVKCTTCAYTWLQRAENDEEKPAFIVPEYTNKSDEFSAPPKQRMTPVVAEKSNFMKIVLVGLSVAAVFLIITLGFAIGMRNDIVARAPASALLFEKMGLPAEIPGKGLTFENITAQTIKIADGKETLNIRGKLANHTKSDIKLQKMLIRLSGESGWLKDWPVDLYGKVAQAGTTGEFTYDLKDFPPNGQSVTLLFAD